MGVFEAEPGITFIFSLFFRESFVVLEIHVAYELNHVSEQVVTDCELY